MILGIDASNIRSGGGITHLRNLLGAAIPDKFGFKRVVVWGYRTQLESLPQKEWLDLREIKVLSISLFHRVYWQNINLTSIAKKNCDILFIPGGLYLGSFRPYVVACQNFLPFVKEEIDRYGFSARTIRLKLLALGQIKTFSNSNGIIFLTNYTYKYLIKKYCHLQKIRSRIIPHGTDLSFSLNYSKKKKIKSYKILYVSTIDFYKHQWNVVSSVSELREKGFDIELILVGPSYPPAMKKLNETINKLDPNRNFVKYEGLIDYFDLPSYYQQADMFVFASTCETFGIGLLEAMASSLPIACSNRLPMPEIVGKAAIFFDPEDIFSINTAIKKLLLSSDLRESISSKAKNRSNLFSWEDSSNETFKFFSDVMLKHKNKLCAE